MYSVAGKRHLTDIDILLMTIDYQLAELGRSEPTSQSCKFSHQGTTRAPSETT